MREILPSITIWTYELYPETMRSYTTIRETKNAISKHVFMIIVNVASSTIKRFDHNHVMTIYF